MDSRATRQLFLDQSLGKHSSERLFLWEALLRAVVVLFGFVSSWPRRGKLTKLLHGPCERAAARCNIFADYYLIWPVPGLISTCEPVAFRFEG